MRFKACIIIIALSLLMFSACQKNKGNPQGDNSGNAGQSKENNGEPERIKETGCDSMTKLLYQGHGSFRLTSQDGTVIYVDPYAGEGYDLPADIILVTHRHADHNQVDLAAQKDGCTVITNSESLEGGTHNHFSVSGIIIEAVEAGNKNHDPKNCVGYIITIDGIKIYAAGDTSKTGQMESLPEKELDYALLPCDGVYNMDLREAAECAKIIGAQHNIPIHMKPGGLFDKTTAENFDAPDKLIVEAGEEIVLEKQ